MEHYAAELKDKDMYVSIAKKLYMSFPSKLPNAEELLTWCKKYYNLALLTRGVKNLQLQKIVKNDLDKYFSENSIKVVPSKDKDTFLYIYSLKKLSKFKHLNSKSTSSHANSSFIRKQQRPESFFGPNQERECPQRQYAFSKKY